jgi:hypothetical protein
VTSATASLRWEDVLARRLERHGLSAPLAGAGPDDVARALCGVHAQILSAAELSVGLRLDGVTRAGVRRALWDDRTLVKTFGPRGTVHLLPTADLALWTGALGAVPGGGQANFPDGVRLSEGQTEAVLAAIDDALAGAELTVDELGAAVVERAGPWAGDLVMPAFQTLWPRWRQAVGAAARSGVLCFGPNKGRNVTYTHPRRWQPGFVPAEPDAALAWLAGTYLAAYGPASAKQFAQWLSTSPAWAAELFARLSAEGVIEPVTLDGAPVFAAAGESRGRAEPAVTGRRRVRLLPYFDAYVVGGRPRELLYPGRAAERALVPSGQAGNYPVLLVDGVVAGVWHQRRSGRRMAVTVEPLEPLAGPLRAELDEEVTRVGEVMEASPALTVGPVSVGPHA